MISSEIHQSLREKYNPDGSDLRKLQLKILDILIQLHSICEANNLTYWLAGGTALGAYRHGGFIPWDDDIDVSMPKEDYLRLLSIIEQNPLPNLVLQTWKSDLHYMLGFSKLRDTNSYIEEAGTEKYKFKGCFIDIFPLSHHTSFMKKISQGLLRIPSYFSKYNFSTCIIKKSKDIIITRVFPILQYFDDIFSNKDFLNDSFGAYFDVPRRKEHLFPPKLISFEGHHFYAPYNIKEYLKDQYGESFMEIPRNIHVHCSSISFK